MLFSYAPLRIMSYVGMFCSLSGFAYALLVIILRLRNSTPVQGWSSLIVVVLVLGGVQMMMLGVLGEYLWRTLEAARRRPSLLPGGKFGDRLRHGSAAAKTRSGAALWDVGSACSLL